MSNVIKIGLVAKRQSGKTTLANMLLARRFSKVTFADPLKDLYVEMFNLLLARIGQPPTFSREQLEEEKELHRTELERFGTVHGRRYDPECWVNLAKREIVERERDYRTVPVRFVCDDVRFLNEVAALRELGFTIIKVVRDEDTRLASIRQTLFEQRKKSLGYEKTALVWGTTLKDIEAWVEAELERTLVLPSEVEVDRIEADITICNTTLEELERHAEQIAGTYLPPHIAHAIDATWDRNEAALRSLETK